MLKIKPAEMRFRINIQQKTQALDSSGFATDTWANIATSVPAQIYAISGRELEAVAQNVAQYNARIVIYKRNVTEDMRIVFDGRNYDIKDIIPDPTNNLYLTLMCKTGFTNG